VSEGLVLGIDTATSRAVVALGTPDGRLLGQDSWPAGHRHSEELLPHVAGVLGVAGATPRQLRAIVVGTGPGGFTGLRVGLATAKTLAHQLRLPIVGVSSAEAIVRSASPAGSATEMGGLPGQPSAGRPGSGSLPARPVLLLPAGSTDRILIRSGARPELLPGGNPPTLEPDETLIAVDLDGRADPAAVARGAGALEGLGAALLALGGRRLLAGDVDDVATLVPEYVTLPRGISRASGAIAWSRDHR
jgi:tRNA threonylcarbamoyl adenosine modification protein YeaZ